MKTVLDANITTLITALILFEYGTGPIKGFAVTLSVGILTSVFSALVITRLLFQLYPGDRPQAALSI
jgi:preprotein translocase subunit SecD